MSQLRSVSVQFCQEFMRQALTTYANSTNHAPVVPQWPQGCSFRERLAEVSPSAFSFSRRVCALPDVLTGSSEVGETSDAALGRAANRGLLLCDSARRWLGVQATSSTVLSLHRLRTLTTLPIYAYGWEVAARLPTC